MKHFYSGLAIALTLALVLVMGVVALAENAGELPAVEDVQPAPETQAPEAQAPETQSDDAALQEALKALMDARKDSAAENLEDELNGYVESGKLTREQADLILKEYKERQAMRDGTCPNCGYEFRNNQGKGGRMNGNGGFGQGNNGGMNGGFGKGGMRGQGMQGGMQGLQGMQGMQGMQGNGMAMTPGAQGMPQMNSQNEGM